MYGFGLKYLLISAINLSISFDLLLSVMIASLLELMRASWRLMAVFMNFVELSVKSRFALSSRAANSLILLFKFLMSLFFLKMAFREFSILFAWSLSNRIFGRIVSSFLIFVPSVESEDCALAKLKVSPSAVSQPPAYS